MNEQKKTNDVSVRMEHFHSLMEPVLHLFPDYLITDLRDSGFFTAPASTKYHGAFEGGLFEHSRNVTQVLVTLTKNNELAWQRPESPYIVGMLTFTGIHTQRQFCTLGMPMVMRLSARRIRPSGNITLIFCLRGMVISP